MRDSTSNQAATNPHLIAFAYGLFPILGMCIAFAFAAYTDHIWEDYLITYKSSKNLALGNGLVYHVGERLHTFTSPLGVLLPGALAFLLRDIGDFGVLWLFRVLSACAFAGTIYCSIRIFRSWKVSPFFSFLFLTVIVTDAKTVDFTINGMETGFMVFFLAMAVLALIQVPYQKSSVTLPWLAGPVRVLGLEIRYPQLQANWLLAIATAGLMWTRPDACILVSSLFLGFIVFRAGLFENWRDSRTWKMVGMSIAIAGVFYLPWFLFATLYYGTPVPNTIVAKGLGTGLIDRFLKMVIHLPTAPLHFLNAGGSIVDTFSPTYAVFGGWPWWIRELSKGLAFVAAFHWALPIAAATGRAISFATFCFQLYLSYIAAHVMPWYIPPVTLLSIFSLTALCSDLYRRYSSGTRYSSLVTYVCRIAVVILCLNSISLLLASARQLAVQQELIENGNRRKIGEWLRAEGTETDSVFMECLGYIGYYSNMKTYDYPGLSSSEVVATRRALLPEGKHSYWDLIIRQLKPTWLVLRPHEVEELYDCDPTLFTEDYSERRIFDVSDQIAEKKFLLGRDYLYFDQKFIIFRRN